jgi:uncharacterized protein YqeY
LGALNESRNTVTSLKDRLHADVVTHMKERNKTALTTVRNVLGEIETREKSGKTPIELDDAQVTTLLQKEAAKRRDTAKIYTDAGEAERAAAEIAEAEVIETYLPRALTTAEVESIIDEVIAGPLRRQSRQRDGPQPFGLIPVPGDRKGTPTLCGRALVLLAGNPARTVMLRSSEISLRSPCSSCGRLSAVRSASGAAQGSRSSR